MDEMTKRLILGMLLAAVAVLLIACESKEKVEGTDATPTQATPTVTPSTTVGTGDETQPAGPIRYRWGKVSIEVQDGTSVARGWDPPGTYTSTGLDTDVLMMKVVIGMDGEAATRSTLIIDANTGAVTYPYQTVQPQHQAEVDRILASLRIEGDDVPETAWPYSATPPTTPRLSWGNITFLEPEPASGITIYVGSSMEEPGNVLLRIQNDRSRRAIDAGGQIFVDSQGQAHDYVDERDRAAFDRFTSSIEVKD
jgi:hypothetical protein